MSDRSFATNPSLSPDGRRLVVTRIVNGNADVWVRDLERGGLLRKITSAPEAETYPLWLSDNAREVFTRSRDLYVQSVSTRGDERLLSLSSLVNPHQLAAKPNTLTSVTAQDASRDGRFLLVRMNGGVTNFDLHALELNGDRKTFPVAQTTANEREGQFSPDAGWIAYESDESGRYGSMHSGFQKERTRPPSRRTAVARFAGERTAGNCFTLHSTGN